MSSDTRTDVGRKRDYLYRLLVVNDTDELETCCAGVCKSLLKYKDCHPCMAELISATQKSRLVQRGVVLFAMLVDDTFMQYLMDRNDTCSVSLSMFRHSYLNGHVQRFLNGSCALSDFVANAAVDYICC